MYKSTLIIFVCTFAFINFVIGDTPPFASKASHPPPSVPSVRGASFVVSTLGNGANFGHRRELQSEDNQSFHDNAIVLVNHNPHNRHKADSDDGEFKLTYQENGNVIVHKRDGAGWTELWASNTSNKHRGDSKRVIRRVATMLLFLLGFALGQPHVNEPLGALIGALIVFMFGLVCGRGLGLILVSGFILANYPHL